jgi:hypothetical protein
VMIEQIGIVTITRVRIYPLPGHTLDDGGMQAHVKPGSYPLFRTEVGVSDIGIFWVMQAWENHAPEATTEQIGAPGSGLFVLNPGEDAPVGAPFMMASQMYDPRAFEQIRHDPALTSLDFMLLDRPVPISPDPALAW